MPRQNFLSRETFVDSTEQQVRHSVLSVPAFAPNISLVAENRMIESYKFNYTHPIKQQIYHINVSVLPLNEKYIRISLHATNSTGQAFHKDADMNMALHDFESAIQAAIQGDTSLYKPYQPKAKASRKWLQVVQAFVASLGVYFMKNKLS